MLSTQEELHAYVTLSLCPGIGARRLLALIGYFQSAERAMQASEQVLQKIEGVGKETAAAIVENRADRAEVAKRQIDKLTEGRALITYFDERYPERLKKIFNPPALLFAEGNADLLMMDKKVAIIGTRRATDYGKRWTRSIAEELARHGVVIVSGFASGIDTHAHVAAFKEGGSTIAVLGSGLDVIYPASNKTFSRELAESDRGLIVSELPFGARPEARNFPWRNRIVSGLSQAIVIVESDEKGGSMITASMALDENREVYAVPGDLDRPTSNGPNLLIRESRARLLRGPKDILADLGWVVNGESVQKRNPIHRSSLNLFENRIVDVLVASGGPLHIDHIAETSELEVQDLLVHLLGLEFKGVVRQLAGKQFSLIN